MMSQLAIHLHAGERHLKIAKVGESEKLACLQILLAEVTQ